MGNRDIAAVSVLFLITLRWQKIAEVFTSKAFRRKGTAALTNIYNYNQGNIEQQSKTTFDTINYKENHFPSTTATSSETQGHSVGARESLNGRENMARRKVKDG